MGSQGRAQDLPDAQATMAAYRVVEGWVRAWDVPADAQLIDPAGAAGSKVVLRLGGKVIGRGSMIGEDRTTLWHAARSAWREAEAGLDIEKDALRAERVLQAAQRITIDIEVAGAITPLLGATWAEASERLSPGIEGVAARVGDEVEAVFPADMLATGVLPGRALQVCAGRLRLPPLELGQLREKQGIATYRFHSQHLTQTQPGEEPMFLTRGGRMATDEETSGPGLRSLADRIARHLLSHRWPGQEPHGMMGNYQALTDSYEPMLAPPREQGIAAFALTRYAATPGVNADLARDALAFATSVVDQLAVVTPDESDPLANPVDSAAWLIARAQVRRVDPARATSHPDFALRAEGVLHQLWNDAPAWAATSQAARAFILYAMAEAGTATADASEMRSAAHEGVRGLFRETDSAELVALMPWLGLAEMTLAAPDGPVPSADALREMRSRLWQSQLQAADLDPLERDLEGGIVFTRGTTPLPTWQGLRPLAFSAVMIGDARLTGAEELRGEIALLRRSLRFVRQLAMDDAAVWLARNPERALGGVRPSLWSPSQSVDASALALMSVSQTLISIAERSSASVPPKGPMGRPQPALPGGIAQ